VFVNMKPSDDWVRHSRLACATVKFVSGSTVSDQRRAPSASRACSGAVTASSAPTEKAPARPVSLAAPRIVVSTGVDANPPSGTLGLSCGCRPIRRE
jgi:hypothetical protein